MRIRPRVAATAAVLAAWLAGCGGPVGPEARRLLLAGNDAYLRGDDRSAIDSTTRFLRMHERAEEAGEAYYVRALAQLRSGSEAAARADLAAALKRTRRPDLTAQANLRLGVLAFAAGSPAEAERHYRAALAGVSEDAPQAGEALYRLGDVLQHQGRWTDADLAFHRAIRLHNGTDWARRAAGRVGATRWSIQAGAFGEPSAARRLAARLTAAGLPARIDLGSRDGRMLRLVRVGSYATSAQARAGLAGVGAIGPDAFVTAAR